MADSSSFSFRGFPPAAIIIAAVLIAYLPALRAGFIWDDDLYVTNNITLHDSAGLKRIWFEPGATPQYYPLVFSSFWMERRIDQRRIDSVEEHIGQMVTDRRRAQYMPQPR